MLESEKDDISQISIQHQTDYTYYSSQMQSIYVSNICKGNAEQNRRMQVSLTFTKRSNENV